MDWAYMENALGNVLSINTFVGHIVSIRVESMVCNDVVFEERLQVLQTVRAEKECVDLGAKLLEGKIRGRKEGSTDVG